MTPETGAAPARRATVAPLLVNVAWLLGLAGTILVAWAAFRLVPFWTWSAARLAASARIALGFPLYSAPGDPLVTGWVYGPVSALAYLPAIAPGEPLAALRVATWLNALYFLLPPLLVSAALWRSRGHRRDGLLLATFGTAALLVPFSTWYGAAALGADTVTICLGVLSCLALQRGHLLPLAAGLCVLSVWSKQIAAPLALAQLGWLAWRGGGLRIAGRYAAWLAAAALVTTLGAGAWFGYPELWYCLVEIPGRHPLETGRLAKLTVALAGSTWWVWPTLGLALARPWARGSRASGANSGEGTSNRDAGAREPAATLAETARLLLLAAMALLPGGLAAAAKAGGDQNSLHAIPFALLAGTALLGAALASPAERLAGGARLAVLAGLAAAVAAGVDRMVAHHHLAIQDPGTQHRAAFAFAQARPGQVYYPGNPLVTLLAERRNLPFDYGVYDWRLAGAAPDPAALRRLLPPALTFVIYHEKDPSRELLRALPEFTRRHESGPWDIYLRAPATTAAEPPPAP